MIEIIENRWMPKTAPRERSVPVFKLSPTLPVSREFRAAINAWLRDTFGHEQQRVITVDEPLIYRMRHPVTDREVLAMHPETARALRDHASRLIDDSIFPKR